MEGVETGAVSPMTTKDEARAAPAVKVIARMNAPRTRTDDNNRLPMPLAAAHFGFCTAISGLIALQGFIIRQRPLAAWPVAL
jgi:hypothetical protein